MAVQKSQGVLHPTPKGCGLSTPCTPIFVSLVLLCFCVCIEGLARQKASSQAVLGSLVLPPSLSLDFSNTLQKPAGGKGFLGVGNDGKFHWANGQRARFWGINVASTRLDIPLEQIAQVVQNFAKAGINMVRLEAIDNRNCLLGSPDSPNSLTFVPSYLERLEYWMYALRNAGIYYYLDLLDFRTFRPGDGVLNAELLDRAARPYAIFDRKLIELQKDYATRLLTNRNRFSGLRPVDDPAFALVEICNEHGFFLYPEKLETLAEPYKSDLLGRWNRWLRDKYATRENLDTSWGTFQAKPVLQQEEDPTKNTVRLPLLTAAITADDIASPFRAPTRESDGVRFLFLLQQSYFDEMKTHLRSIGLRIPVTAVVSNDILPDLLSVATVCDFTAGNWYGEMERFDSRTPGMRYYSNENPLRLDNGSGAAPYTSALRWQNKPVVIREFATSPPNPLRLTTVPEMLAYASLQDYDAVLLFAYQTNRAPNGMEADALNDYAFQSDPTVWGLYALAGQAFLKGAVRPAKSALTLAMPESYIFRWPSKIGTLHRASWSQRVQNVFSQPTSAPDTRTPTGDAEEANLLTGYLKAKQAAGLPVRAEALQDGLWTSDTGEIRRITAEGRLEIRTPTFRALAGALTPNKIYDLGGGVRFASPNPIAAVFISALDGLPIATSKRVVVKMVSRAENTGQVLTKAKQGFPGAFVLQTPGTAPVLTFGRASETPARIWLKPSESEENAFFALWMRDGTWEIELRDGRIHLTCDTPNLKGKALGNWIKTGTGVVEILPNGTQKAATELPAQTRRLR